MMTSHQIESFLKATLNGWEVALRCAIRDDLNDYARTCRLKVKEYKDKIIVHKEENEDA